MLEQYQMFFYFFLFSERERSFTLAIYMYVVVRPSVCRLSVYLSPVTFVLPI